MYKILRINFLSVLLALGFITLIAINPIPCREGAAKGLLLCGRVIIPAIFPFTFCVLFVMRTGALEKMNFLEKFTQKLFGLTSGLFSLALISFIGGYPIGAKILSTAVENKKISPQNAGIMLNYCINAGPAFIISAVGSGILGSSTLGFILFASHVLASVILCFLSRFTSDDCMKIKEEKKIFGVADNFVLSVKESADTSISICSFVILFSAFNQYLEVYSARILFLKWLCFFTEITNSVTLTNNVYIISFLLGFGGISIWCQVVAMGKNIKIKPLNFFAFRLFHGALGLILTYAMLHIFKITVPTLSNGKHFSDALIYSTPAVSVSMIIMCIIFIISLSTKKIAGKILSDVI